MIPQLLVLFLYCCVGWGVVHASGLRSGWLALLSFPIGVGVCVSCGGALALLGLPTRASWSLSAPVLVVLAAWWLAGRQRFERKEVRDLLGLLVLACVVTWVVGELRLVTWHSDSFSYLIASELLAHDALDIASPGLLRARMIGLPLVHAPQVNSDSGYLVGFAPLLAVHVLWALGHLCFRALQRQDRFGSHADEGFASSLFATLMVLLLLATNNRFLWHATYLNGHLLVAVYVLLLSGIGWLQARQLSLPRAAFILIQSLCASQICLLRPEGVIVASLALLPCAVSTALSRTERVVPLLACGATALLWNLKLITMVGVSNAPSSVLGGAAAGALEGFGAFLLVRPVFQPLLKHLLFASEVGMWGVLAVLGALRPTLLERSIEATWSNVGDGRGSWGSSLLVLTLLGVLVLVFTRSPHRAVLRFPLVTFIPAVFIMAYLRERPYRVGHGDSLNRMFIHMVPLGVLLVGSVFGAELRRFGRTSPSADPRASHSPFPAA